MWFTDAGDLGVSGEQAVDERAVGIAGSRVHHESGRLVYDDHVIVVMDDAELYVRVGRRQFRLWHRRRVDADRLAHAQAELAGGAHLTVDGRSPGIDHRRGDRS